MNSLRKNQSGYALITVLLIIAIIGVVTPPIISNIINSTQQFKRSEENIQLEKLREMGINYMENSLQHIVNNSEPPTGLEQYKTELESKLYQFVPELGLRKEMKEDAHAFRLIVESVEIEGNDLKITYRVTPTLNGIFEESNSSVEEKIIKIRKVS
ncbi:hypothetical protein [Lederbergia graminis]|uniref:Type II secretion system protein n=1 Tax=Lederbergia graminis TaxID=735518 RepID=A0ABW0LH31_9BACI